MVRKSIYAPILFAFAGSVSLSMLALYFDPILPRDSTLYVDVAGFFARDGLATPTDRYDWPWLSILIALVHKYTGLTLISSGHVIMALQMACMCAILTRATQLFFPAAAWWGCLASLSLPAFNQYRDAILREPGFWMFTALTLLIVSAWSKKRNWNLTYICCAALSIIAAMSFRLEAVFLFGALLCAVAHNFREPKERPSILRALFLIILFLLISCYLFTLNRMESNRFDYYLQLLSPQVVLEQLNNSTSALKAHILQKYAHDSAPLVIFFGYLGVILFTALKLFGPFLFTLDIFSPNAWKGRWSVVTVFSISGIVLYISVLLIFFIQQNFIIDRYVAVIHILAVPLLSASAWKLKERFPAAGYILASVAILVALSNVISFSDNRTHYQPAGRWIDQNLPAESEVYYADGRISFYAGRHYQAPPYDEPLALGPHFASYDYFVLESSESPALQRRLVKGELREMSKFSNGGRHKIIIFARTAGPSVPSSGE